MTDPSPTESDPARPVRWGGVVLLALVVLTTYAPAVGLGFVYDDQVLLLTAPAPSSPGDYVSIFTERRWPMLPYYRPVAWLTLAAQHQLHGLQPLPYHLFNGVLAVAAALACFSLFRVPAFRIPRGAALAGAALFAVHPLASSVVYPVAGRETLLAGVFGIVCVAAFFRGRVGLSALCFALAVFSKEHAVAVLPALVWADLLGLSVGSRGGGPGRWFARYAPFVLVLVAYLSARAAILPSGGLAIALLEQPLGPLFSLAYSLQTSLVPFVQLVYEPAVEIWASPARLAVALLSLVALAVALVRAGSANRRPVLFFVGWTVLCLVPSANLVFQESLFAERYGWLALSGWLGVVLVALRAHAGRPLLIAGLVLVSLCGLISFQRGPYYADDEAFLTQWLATNPTSLQARVALGGYYKTQDEPKKAIAEYRLALESAPDSPLANAAMGEFLLARRRPAHALEYVRRAADLAPDDHQYQNLLGATLARLGEREAAIDAYRRALRIFPDYAHAHNNLGVVLLQEGRPDEALASFEHALRLRPDYVEAIVNLARASIEQGDEAQGVEHYRRALELRPAEGTALLGLSRTLATARDPALRDPHAALRLARRVVDAAKRPSAGALEAVALAHAAAGNPRDAVRWQQRAIEAAPERRAAALGATLARYRQDAARIER